MSKATKTMKKIAKKNGWPVVDIKTTAKDPADLGGLPTLTQQAIAQIDQSINEETAERYYKMMEEDKKAAAELKRGREVAREREQDKDCNIKFACSNCGSSNVGTVGVISWYADEQKWGVGCIYDDDTHAYCGDCDADNSKGSSIRLLPVEA